MDDPIQPSALNLEPFLNLQLLTKTCKVIPERDINARIFIQEVVQTLNQNLEVGVILERDINA